MANNKVVPFAIAIIGHAALIGLLLWNFEFDKTATKHKYVDAPVTAKLVTTPEKSKKDAQSLKRKQQEAEKRKIERQKEAKRQEALKQQEIKQQEQKKQQDDKKALEEQAIQRKQQQDKEKQRIAKELEQKKKQQEIDRKKKAEADKKRQADLEKKKKLEAEKKRKAEAERKRKEAERKKQQEIADMEASLDDELFEADLGDVRQTQVMSEVAKLQAAIRSKIIRNWNEPQHEGLCVIRIQMGPGGVVLSTESIEGDANYCDTGVQAIQRSSPLPSSEDPEVMSQLRSFTIRFDPSQKL